MLVDIAILDYSTCQVVMLKVDDKLIEEKFNNNLQSYVNAPVEEGGLGYKEYNVSYMCHSRIKVTCLGGSPRGGIEIEECD